MKQAATPAVPFRDKKVAAVFAAYPESVRARLMALRGIIFETAEQLDGVGPLHETLKWGQPSYLTTESGSGSTVRIDRPKPGESRIAIYFHCQTDLVATFRELYPTQMEYGGNRSILLEASTKIPAKALRHCIGLALTYHARKMALPNSKKILKETASLNETASGKQRAPGETRTASLRTRRERPS